MPICGTFVTRDTDDIPKPQKTSRHRSQIDGNDPPHKKSNSRKVLGASKHAPNEPINRALGYAYVVVVIRATPTLAP